MKHNTQIINEMRGKDEISFPKNNEIIEYKNSTINMSEIF